MTAAAESTPESATETTPETDPGAESAAPIEPEADAVPDEDPSQVGAEAEPEPEATPEPEAEAGPSAGAESEPAAETAAASEPAAEEEPEAAKDSVITSAVPHPSAVPGPRKADAEPADSSAASADTEPWGRVDDDGTVSVREADGWRVVGQYPDGTAEEALAYYRRKFSDLASEVALLEVRHRRGGAPAADLRSTAKALHAKLQDAAAVGNLAALDARVLALTGELTEASATEAAASRQAVDDAVRARTELVEKAEALAARDHRSVQ